MKMYKMTTLIVAMSMLVVCMPTTITNAAKKPKLIIDKKILSPGETTKVRVVNCNKKAKITWKLSKKSIIKIVKKSNKVNKTYATFKGLKVGKVNITATYKLGKKITRLRCNVVVRNVNLKHTSDPSKNLSSSTPDASISASNSPNNSVNNPTNLTTNNPTELPAEKQTAKPIDIATQTPITKPKDIDKIWPDLRIHTPMPTADTSRCMEAFKVPETKLIQIDGKVSEGEAWEYSYGIDNGICRNSNFIPNNDSTRGRSLINSANARLMFSEDTFYVLLDVNKARALDNDSIDIYFDEDNESEGSYEENKNAVLYHIPLNGEATRVHGVAKCVSAVSVQNNNGYIIEAGISIERKNIKCNSNDIFRCEIQINDGDDCTINYFDQKYEMVYDSVDNMWRVTEKKIAVDKDTSFMGRVKLNDSAAPATKSFHTSDGEAIRKEAGLESGTKDKCPDDEYYPYNAESMNFVNPEYWHKVYEANGQKPIYFSNAYVPAYRGNDSKISLADCDAEGKPIADLSGKYSKAYAIWDGDFLYVLFDINDKDIAPESDDKYITDSTEIYLDEDASRGSSWISYEKDQDEALRTYFEDTVMLRVGAKNNQFSTNTSGTCKLKSVAHAVNYKKTGEDITGYQVEYIIELNSKHEAGDILGIDMKINDCFSREKTEEDIGYTVPESKDNMIADRAGVISLYDSTDYIYNYPYLLGRLVLE